MQKQLKFKPIRELALNYYMIKKIAYIKKLKSNKLEKRPQIIKKDN
jgi:hypothetical protein